MKTKLFVCSSGTPAVTVNWKLLARAIVEIVFRPWHFCSDFSTTFPSRVTNPFSGILGQDLNLPWFQSFQIKPGFAAVWMFSFTEVNPTLTLKTSCVFIIVTHWIFSNMKGIQITDGKTETQRDHVICPSGRLAFDYSAVLVTTCFDWTGVKSFR